MCVQISLGECIMLGADYQRLTQFIACRCYQAILNAIQPLLPKDSKYHDQHIAEVTFEKMLPGIISLANDALPFNPSLEWIQICKRELS